MQICLVENHVSLGDSGIKKSAIKMTASVGRFSFSSEIMQKGLYKVARSLINQR